MPIIKSAQKQMRQDVKRAAKNKPIKEAYKAAVKKVETAAEKGKVARDLVSEAYGAIDKAVKHNLMHENKGARLKARVSKLARENK